MHNYSEYGLFYLGLGLVSVLGAMILWWNDVMESTFEGIHTILFNVV